MARGFENKDTASKAGQKSKRTRSKIPYELKQILAEGSLNRVPKLWEHLDLLKGKEHLTYLIKILQLVVPKDLNIEGDVTIDGGDAKRKLIEKLLARAGETSDSENDK